MLFKLTSVMGWGQPSPVADPNPRTRLSRRCQPVLGRPIRTRREPCEAALAQVGLLRDRLPAAEVEYAIEDALLQAGHAGASPSVAAQSFLITSHGGSVQPS